MKDKKMKFVIVSPRQTGGGAIVLHKLCKLLADRGYDAKIFHIVFLVSLHVFRIRWSFFVFACRAEMRRLK